VRADWLSRPARDFAVLLLFSYVLIAAVPIGESGALQLSHLVAVALVITVATGRRFEPDIHPWLLPWFTFCVYAVAVAASWGARLGSAEPLLLALPYLLGAGVLWVVPVLARQTPSILVTGLYATCIATGIGLNVMLMLAGYGYSVHVERGTLAFANPNQLAYFCLLIASVAAACAFIVGHGRLAALAGLVTMAVPVVVTQSKAGILGAIVLLGVIVFFPVRRRLLSVSIALAVAGYVIVQYGDAVLDLVPRWRSFATEADDTLAARGYDRLWRYPEYLLFGAGEGEYERFAGLQAVEIHSSVVNILFSYGLVGFLLFAYGSLRVLIPAGRWAMLLLPAVAYGMTHNGLRQPLLWILVGLCAIAPALHVALRVRRADPALSRHGTTSP